MEKIWKDKESWCVSFIADCLIAGQEKGMVRDLSYLTEELRHRIREEISNAIQSAKEEEREKWRLKNAGLYRQLFGETDKTYTSKELWEILDSYAPLFTEEQIDNLNNSIMKKS